MDCRTRIAQPIAIIDSGVGGLSVARQIRAHLPAEDILYIADSANAPYGDKSVDFITGRLLKISALAIEHGAKAIVVACNSATVSAISTLREEVEVPVIGVEPGIKPAIEQSASGIVGVIATARTVQSPSLRALIRRVQGKSQVILQACPGLVEQIEQNQLHTQETLDLLHRYIDPMVAHGADTLVLGCTHYPFLKPLLEEKWPDLVLIDTSHAVTRQLITRLENEAYQEPAARVGKDLFWSSKASNQPVIETIWQSSITLNAIPD